MKRLTLYFITALLLLSGLLGYWWVREYQDRRDQLRREIQSGAREYSLGVMLDLAMNMGEVTTAGDTILRIDIQQADGVFREAAAGDTLLGFEKMLVSLARRDTFRGEFYQPIREMNPTFSEGSDRMAEELTERFGVTIFQLDRQQRAERFSRGDTTMLVQQTLLRRHALDPERPTLSIVGYRRAILLGMLPEFA